MSPKSPDLIVARMAPDVVLLKRLLRANDRAVLLSSNPSYPPAILDGNWAATIIGKVIYAIRYYK